MIHSKLPGTEQIQANPDSETRTGDRRRSDVFRDCHRVIAFLILWAVLAPLGVAQVPLPSGQISGVVQTDEGKVLNNAPVECRVANVYIADPKTKRPVRNPAYSFPSRRVVADSGGKYSCQQLPDGPYYVCAYGVQPHQLPSCQWNTVPERVVAVAGGKAPTTNLTVKTGIVLRIRANDAKGRFSKAKPALFAVNVETFGYRGMQLVSRNGTQEVREVAIPRNTRVWVVSGRNYDFGGASTPAVNQQAASQQIEVPNGLQLHTIDLEAK